MSRPALLVALGAMLFVPAILTGGEELRISAGTCLPPMTPEGKTSLKDPQAAISWTAAPGQFEPGVITIEADKELKGLRVEVGDLKDPKGSTIKGERIRLQRVRMRGVKQKKDGAIVVYPEFLLPWEGSIDIKAGVPSFVWLTLATPSDAKAGNYTGELAVITTTESQKVKLNLKVLPFSPVKPKIVYSMLYTYEFRYLERWESDYQPARKRRDKSGRPGFIKRGKTVVRDLAEHGMNTIFPHSSRALIRRNGKPFCPDLYASLDAAKAEKMLFNPGWFIGWFVNAQWKDLPKFNEKRDVVILKEIAAEAARAAKERGFRNAIVVPSDEPNHPKKLVVARKLLTGAGKIDGVRWAVTGNGPTLKELADLYDIAIIAGGTPADWAELKKRGKELWLYENNATTGRNPLWSRFVYGLHGWRAGFDGVASWTYPPHVEDYRGGRTDARDSSKIPTFTRTGLPVATLVWEAIREGVDDRRYIDTLEAEVAAATRGNEKQKEAAKKGQAFLASLKKRIDPDLKAHHWEHTEYGAPKPKGFDWAEMEKVRQNITTLVLELKASTPSQ